MSHKRSALDHIPLCKILSCCCNCSVYRRRLLIPDDLVPWSPDWPTEDYGFNMLPFSTIYRIDKNHNLKHKKSYICMPGNSVNQHCRGNWQVTRLCSMVSTSVWQWGYKVCTKTRLGWSWDKIGRQSDNALQTRFKVLDRALMFHKRCQTLSFSLTCQTPLCVCKNLYTDLTE